MKIEYTDEQITTLIYADIKPSQTFICDKDPAPADVYVRIEPGAGLLRHSGPSINNYDAFNLTTNKIWSIGNEVTVKLVKVKVVVSPK